MVEIINGTEQVAPSSAGWRGSTYGPPQKASAMERIGVHIQPSAWSTLSIGERQRVEIVEALSTIRRRHLDQPTVAPTRSTSASFATVAAAARQWLACRSCPTASGGRGPRCVVVLRRGRLVGDADL